MLSELVTSVMDHEQRITKAAHYYLGRLGVSVIPLRTDKRPACEWTPYQSRLGSLEEATHWHANNLGLVTGRVSGIVVVDCESREDAEWFWRHRGKTNVIVSTPRGFHLYFAWPGTTVNNGTHIDGRYDIRGDGGYVVCPPSVVNGHEYQFVRGCHIKDAETLPTFQLQWRWPNGPERQPKQHRRIGNAVSYIRQIRAVSGNGGHSDTWRAVNRLRDGGLSEAEALAALIEWNQTNCEPAWTTAELLHKVQDCYSREPNGII